MNNSQIYHKWKSWLNQLIPDQCGTRQANMAWLMMGLYMAKSIHLEHIACQIPIRVKKLSLSRRLSRFLKNEAVGVADWYARSAQGLIASAASGGQLNLVLDTTKVSSAHRLLCIGVAYQRRTLPLIWDWVGHRKGHCTVNQQLALRQNLQALIPSGVCVSLVGDGEFGNWRILALLDDWGWNYALRQAKNTQILQGEARTAHRLDQLPIQRGQIRIWRNVRLTEKVYLTNLLVVWRASEKEPIFLATNQTCVKKAWRLYKRRMWIEEMFGDMKGHGFDLEKTRLRHPARLNRLILAVSLVYLWRVSVGEHVLVHNLAAEIDRSERRDLSIFRLGWDFLKRRLTLNDPLPDCFRPAFSLVSGS